MKHKEYSKLKDAVREYIISFINISEVDRVTEKLENETRERINNFLSSRSSVFENKEELINMLINDILYFGFLTEWLKRKDIEEININAYDDIDIYYRNGVKEKHTNGFSTAQEEIDVIKKMLRIQTKTTIDNSKPIAYADLNKNTRITAVGYGAVDENVGIIASIRFIGKAQQSKDTLLEKETATEEMLEFLNDCVNNGVSVAVAGAVGAGKTNTASYLLSSLPNETRIISCEEGSREIDITKRNEKGEKLNSVVYLKTVESENEENVVTLADLIRTCLRLDPDVIFVSEMRSKEAYNAQEAGRTGTTVITTLHSNNAISSYSRMVTMSKEAVNFDEETLYNLMIDAFPIIVYQKKMKDNSRKITEIIETEKYHNGNFTYRKLWQYEVDTVDELKDKTIIKGSFKKCSGISNKLKEVFISAGLPHSQIEKWSADTI